MPLINHSIPNLINGVSQQAETLRLGSQGETQINGFSSVVEGLKKRPPTEFIKRISNSAYSNAFVHTINRDTNERYILVITQNNIEVYGIDGTSYTVNTPSGTSYLNIADPKSNLRAVTIADYTFIVNKSQTVAMDSTLTASGNFEAIYSITQGVDQTKYTLTINGTAYTYTSTTTAADYQSTNIATQIFNQISGLSGFTVTNLGSDLHITSATDFTISATDGYGNQASQVIKGETDSFSDLPDRATNDFKVEITGDPANAFDNYYVKYESDSSTDGGVYKETVVGGTKDSLDVSTMPHVLIRQADGNFRFTPCNGSTYTISGTDYDVPEWGSRLVGDEISAPNPSFVDRQISDIFFHRNRLGFLADENVIMSRAGEFFKFYTETVTTILDSDPIDVAVSHTKVSILRHAIPFNEDLLLFSDQSQFLLRGTTTLTASNVDVATTTDFENDKTCKPVAAGKNVYFIFNKGQFSGVREFFIRPDSDQNDADDITSAVPKFIPSNVYKMSVATNENILCLLSEDEENAVYVYQWYIANNQRLQSAWHKWTLGNTTDTKILNADFIETDLYLVVERSDGVHIVKMQTAPAVIDTDSTYLTHLDMKVNESSTGLSTSYNAGTNQTTITLPYDIDDTMQVVTRNVNANSTIAGQIIPIISTGSNTIVVSGDKTSTKFFVGEKYTFEYQFSQQYIQYGQAQSQTAVKEGRLQIRNWTITYDNTGHFRVEVTPKSRSTVSETFTGAIVGVGTVNGINLEDGDYTFPIMSRNEGLVVKLINDEYLPSAFINAEWQGFYNQQSSQNT
jgi:hypothetical protein